MGSMAFYFLLVLCTSSTLVVNSTILQKSDDIEQDSVIFQKYVELDKTMKKLVNSGVKAILPYILEGSQHLNVSSSCSQEVFKIITDVRKLKLSAIRLLDATAKVPEGVLSGNIFMVGDYDECVNIAETRNDGGISYKGQYCMVDVKPKLPRRQELITLQSGIKGLKKATENSSELMQHLASILHYTYRFHFKFGLCVPSGCSSEDINSVVNYIGNQVTFDATVEYCTVKRANPISTGKIIAIFFFSLFGLLSILGTTMDYYARKKDTTFQSQFAKVLLCFSILTNFPKVISAKTTDTSLSSLFGIRSLSLFYIILQHNYFFLEKFSIEAGMMHYAEKIPSFFMQIIWNGYLTTEVFIFLGGLLQSYSTIKYMEKSKRKISYVTVIIHRVLRIYPPYLFVMMSIYILKNFNGPFSAAIDRTYWQNCDKNWWHNLIFINNFFNQQNACLFHGWYIAADMHLFLISLFTLPLLAKNPKKGISLHLGILVLGLLCTGLWAWHKNILPALILARINMDELNEVWNVYTTTFPHIAPYFAGVLFGYAIITYKDFKIPMIYRIIGWPTAAVAFMSMLFMTQRWNSGVEPSVLGSVLYFSVSRLIYVTAVGWMILCCVRGYGGIVNYILSLQVWIPISRISYMMFLISPIIQTLYISHLTMTVESGGVSMIWRYLGDLGASFIVALAMTTIIESPFVALEKVIFRRHSTEGKTDIEKSNQTQSSKITDEKVQVPINEMEMENNFKNAILDMQLKPNLS